MPAQSNKTLIERSVKEFWNGRNHAVVDQLYATDFRSHDPNGTYEGDLAQFKQAAAAVLEAVPDLELTIEALVAEGDLAVKRWSARGTHKADLAGISATGNAIAFSGTTTYRIANGKLAECWWNSDALTLMRQLGVVPTEG